MGKAIVFFKSDLRQGFLQIPFVEGDEAKTCYWVGNRLTAYHYIPYGLRDASTHFQRVMGMELALAGLNHCAIAFIDDVLIWSHLPEHHQKHVTAVLDMLQACGIRAHPDKTIFGADVIKYTWATICANSVLARTRLRRRRRVCQLL